MQSAILYNNTSKLALEFFIEICIFILTELSYQYSSISTSITPGVTSHQHQFLMDIEL